MRNIWKNKCITFFWTQWTFIFFGKRHCYDFYNYVIITSLFSLLATLAVYLWSHLLVHLHHFYSAMLCIRGTSHGPVSVRLSVTSRCSTKTAERIELVFGMWAFFHPSYTVLKGNLVIFKNKGTSLWNFALHSGLRKFRHCISIVETYYQLSSRKVDADSVINWAVVGQLSR